MPGKWISESGTSFDSHGGNMKLCRRSFVLVALSVVCVPLAANANEPVAAYATVLPNGDQADVCHPMRSRAPHMPPDGYAVVAFLQGALVDKSNYSAFATELASFGFIV